MKIFGKILLLILIAGEIFANSELGSEAESKKGKYPYLASYQYGMCGFYRHFCGGSIIGHRWILTAAHCAMGVPWPMYTKIVAGITALTEKGAGRQDGFVKHTLIHPKYDKSQEVGPNDIALLKLEKELRFTENVQPIPLQTLPKVSGSGLIIGWGLTDDKPNKKTLPNVVQIATVPIITTAECKEKMGEYIKNASSEVDYEANICTGSKNTGAGTCSGDSGGPLVHAGKMVGVVSWGLSPCGAKGAPSVFARVSTYAEYIKEQMDKD